MKIQVQKTLKKGEGLLVVPYFQDYQTKYPTSYNADIKALIKKALKDQEFEGKLAETIYFTIDSKVSPQKIVIMGCGKVDKFDQNDARRIGAGINSEARKHKQKKVTILMTPEFSLYTEELTEGLILKNYRISKYKTGDGDKEADKKEVKEAVLVSTKADKVRTESTKGRIIAEAVNMTKDLVNGPANIVDAEYFVKVAKRLGRDFGYGVKVFNKDKLKKLGWGGLLSVNKGAEKPAKCLILEYKGGKRSEKPVILVGKGVIFDTGGYNLKPTKYIEDMHSDKAGASAVMGVFAALKELRIEQNVIGILPLTENMVDGKSTRPSDIVTMLNGQTVEIGNTDAEGRVILADALTYGVGRNPAYMIDIATLTGAAMVALGDRYSAVFSNDKRLKDLLVDAGAEMDDPIWELPLHKDHKEKMKSQVADLRNADAGTSYLAGASKGAAFLSYFIKDAKGKDAKWAHIDIGGTAYTNDPRKYEQKGATGSGVRVLLRFLEGL